MDSTALEPDYLAGQMSPAISVLVTSYERPGHLRHALASIGQQQISSQRLEVVVTDDGSTDDTLATVAQFAEQSRFPVKATVHVHDDFRIAQCRNEGVLVSSAPYLVFCDGDCVLPPDHIAIHWQRRRQSTVSAGDCYRLSQATTARFNTDTVRHGRYTELASRSERKRLRHKHRKAVMYNLLRHPTKPKLIGNNFSVWRNDYARINGFDEQFVGWGCEDDDFRIRLRRAGVQIRSILKWTRGYHLWHPPVPSCPDRWREGPNVTYFEASADRPARCRCGLQYPRHGRGTSGMDARPKFAEVLFAPGRGSFSGHANVNVLVVDALASPASRNRADADIVVTRDDAHHLVRQLTISDSMADRGRKRLRVS